MFPTVDGEDITQGTSCTRNTSPSRNARDSPEATQISRPNNNRELTLNMLIKEMVFCIALALTTYGALHNTPTKISKHPQAVRFFKPDSVVTDWYKGQLSNALVHINTADVAFVMYYAPWDAESQYVREEFEKAAAIMGDRVHFAAINCWNPGSECRLQHSKIPSWPILMAYTINSRGVLYKGPREAHHMVRFLELVIKPIEKISNLDELVTKIAVCDVVAVAFIPMAPTSKFYNSWYQVALKMKEFDVHGEFCFGVVTNEPVAISIGATHFPSARLMLWNETKEFKSAGSCQDGDWNETNIMIWLLENFDTPASRVVPMWKKAFSFEKYVDGNPILILFTPLNPLYEEIPNYLLLREVAMEYHMYCRNKGVNEKMTEQSLKWTTEEIGVVKVQRYMALKRNYDQKCEESKPTLKPQKPKYLKKVVVSQNNKWRNTTQKHKKESAIESLVKKGLNPPKIIEGPDSNSDVLGTVSAVQECDTKSILLEKSESDNFDQCHLEEDSSEHETESAFLNLATFYNKETSMLPLEDDPLAAEGLFYDRIRHFCKIHYFAKEWGLPIFPEPVDEAHLSHIYAYSCKKNFTLKMIAIDSVENHHFAESLGIDIKNMDNMTAVVILDTKNQSQFVMKEKYSAKSLREFIRNFTLKRLKRSLRTHVQVADFTHYYGSDGPTDNMENDTSFHVTDLTTKTFRKFVRAPGKVSIVAVCGGACGAHTTRSLTEAARVLNSCGVPARAARIDALRHDLPWHYTAANYPTILVFYTRKGSNDPESRAYPARARITSSGLVALALQSLGTPLHLRVRLVLCARSQVTADKKICLHDLKEQVETTIGRDLKYWRRTEDQQLKEALVKRLQYLRQVSLETSLLDITDLHDSSPKYNAILKSLSTLSRNWDIKVGVLKNLPRPH